MDPTASPTVRFAVLEDTGDARGLSVTLASRVDEFLGRARDTHVTTIRPGAVRGNHFHKERREALIVMHKDAWSLHWRDGGVDGADRRHDFSGAGVVLVELEPPCPHALRNEGSEDLWVVAHCDGPFDPAAPDSYPEPLIR